MCPVSSVPSENDRSHLRAHTIDTSTSLASPAQPTRDLEAAEHTPQPAGGHLSDVVGDDHDRRKLVQDPKQLPQVDSSGQRLLPKPANPNNHLITEDPPSTTAQNEVTADVIDQHRELPFICSTLYAAPKDLGRHKQINIIPMDYTSWQFLSSPSKVVASAHGSLQLHIGTRGLRPKEGNPVSFLEQVPPWPPPLCTSSSPKHASNIFRGGRNNKMSILVAVTNPATCHTCPTQNFHKLHVQVTIGRFGRSAVCTFQLLSVHNDRHNVMVCNSKSRAKQLAVSSNHSVPHNQIMNQELICITVLVLDLDVHLYVTVDGQTTLDGRRK
ncbi:uncharacterized protein LOC119769640 [Culex quinquefasciatus]|uniref:uncharacterized protein LOC119769640 n=1 Tax=Culex quinquefasciatus TaxID=7176 RepID=UPI0018E2A534|nr:uncharacterized protein LOC119769640 [Culex quinquefasciatus]